MTVTLSPQQVSQEEQYYFPYHYLDLLPRYAYQARTEQSYRSIVRGLIGPGRGQSVLDAGCGDGRFLYDMRGADLRVTGADYSAQALAFGRAFCPGVEFIQADLTWLSLDRKFDFIVMLEVLEHLAPDVAGEALGRLAGCLADGGRLIVSVPSTREKMPPKHYRHFTPATLGDTLGPRFRIERLIGHLRVGLRYRLYRLLLAGTYVMGPLRTKTLLARPYFWAIERLLRPIETCQPARASRLIAVCAARQAPAQE